VTPPHRHYIQKVNIVNKMLWDKDSLVINSHKKVVYFSFYLNLKRVRFFAGPCIKIKIYRTITLPFAYVWVWNLVAHIEGSIYVEGVREYGVEKDNLS
jgi:hypothetical protein